MSEKVHRQSAEDDGSLAEVVDLKEYADAIDRMDPHKFSDKEMLSFILTKATHVAVRSDAHRTAQAILDLLAETADTGDEWNVRARALKVDVAELDDDQYDTLSQDPIVEQALGVIKSKSGHYAGSESIVLAARELINLRGGVVVRGAQYGELLDAPEWSAIIEALELPVKG